MIHRYLKSSNAKHIEFDTPSISGKLIYRKCTCGGWDIIKAEKKDEASTQTKEA